MEWEEPACRQVGSSGQATELTMIKSPTLARAEIESLDRFYREGGLRSMASPHVHYDDPACPHAGCTQRLEWIDFKLELHGDPEGIYKPLVRSWWEGTGFVGRCPSCRGWIRFTTLVMATLDDEAAGRIPQLPENWAAIALIA
jgi:hypothetical protein